MEFTNEQQNMRRVVVTGAAGSLGSKVIEQFVEAGCDVIAVDRAFPATGLTRHHEIHRLSLLACDLTHPNAVEAAFETIVGQFGGVDAVIHCAGGFRFSPAGEVPASDVDFLVDLNLKSSMYVLKESLRIMKPANFGRIVMVSSASAIQPGFGVSAYAASKLGLHALLESVAAEVKELDINIHAVAPSVIDTPPNRRDMPDADFSKWVSPVEIAHIMFLLTQPAMDVVRHCILPISGKG